jgi:hypothetical protein
VKAGGRPDGWTVIRTWGEKATGLHQESHSRNLHCPSVRLSVGPPRHGGAGNRTLVRVRLQNRVYVCRLDFLPSLRSGFEPTSPKSIS